MTDFDPWAALVTPESARVPRSLETRESSERPRQWVEPTLLPTPDAIPGWRFKWVRMSSRGLDDKNNVSKRLREGWEFVRAEDHPEILAKWYMPLDTKGTLESGGLVLCKMPQEMVDQRNAHILSKTLAGLDSAENAYMRDQSEVMKKIADNKRRVVFGRDRAR